MRARLEKYVRNKYFKLSRKSKTVNGMMYRRAPAFIPHSCVSVCTKDSHLRTISSYNSFLFYLQIQVFVSSVDNGTEAPRSMRTVYAGARIWKVEDIGRRLTGCQSYLLFIYLLNFFPTLNLFQIIYNSFYVYFVMKINKCYNPSVQPLRINRREKKSS